MKLPKSDQMEQCMVRGTENRDDENSPITWDQSSGSNSPRADFTTARFIAFRHYVRDSIESSLVSGRLKGCRVPVIISR